MKKKYFILVLFAFATGILIAVILWNRGRKPPLQIPSESSEKPTPQMIIEKIPADVFSSKEFSSITILDQDTFVAIDRQSKKLIKFSIPTKKKGELLQSPVEKYSLSYPFLFVEPGSQVIDLDANTSYQIDASSVSPFSSPAISPEGELAVLGNISVTRHTADVFIFNRRPENILSIKKGTSATLISWLDNNHLILQTTSEAPDSGSLEIIDTNGQTIFSVDHVNSFGLSPNKRQMATMTLESILLIDLTTNSRTNISIPRNSKMKWVDDQNILILIPDKTGTRLSLLNTSTLKSGPVLPLQVNANPVFIVGIVGISNNYVFVIDSQGSLLRIKMPLSILGVVTP